MRIDSTRQPSSKARTIQMNGARALKAQSLQFSIYETSRFSLRVRIQGIANPPFVSLRDMKTVGGVQ